MGTYIYKACTTTCTEQSRYFGFSTFDVLCCNDTNRCNKAQYSTFFNHSSQLILTFTCVIFLFLIFYRSTTVRL